MENYSVSVKLLRIWTVAPKLLHTFPRQLLVASVYFLLDSAQRPQGVYRKYALDVYDVLLQLSVCQGP